MLLVSQLMQSFNLVQLRSNFSVLLRCRMKVSGAGVSVGRSVVTQQCLVSRQWCRCLSGQVCSYAKCLVSGAGVLVGRSAVTQQCLVSVSSVVQVSCLWTGLYYAKSKYRQWCRCHSGRSVLRSFVSGKCSSVSKLFELCV